MSIEQAARLLGITPRAVYYRLARGKLTREELEDTARLAAILEQEQAARAQSMALAAAAQICGVSRRSIYRWQEQRRLPRQLDLQALLDDPPRPRQRGPQRSRWSKRYTIGRHIFRAREEA